MPAFSKSGANVSTKLEAIDAFELCRPCISPAIRWEKKSMGILSTCHINVLLPTMESLPFILSE